MVSASDRAAGRMVFLSQFLNFSTLPLPAAGWRDPATGQVIAHGERKQDQEPAEAGAGDDPGEAAAVADVHEKLMQVLVGGRPAKEDSSTEV
jgi:hypothetical protein